MLEDTREYQEIMRMPHETLQILRKIEEDIEKRTYLN